MSSWKKASKAGQKFHKERGQLKDREHLGFLEKKQDYKLRALDFQKKRETIKDLKRKVQEKNPDEYYFNMVKTRVKEGTHQLKNTFKEYTDEEIQLMKTQDKNYIKFHGQMEKKKIEKLKTSMHLIDVEDMPTNQHRFFVDDKETSRAFTPAKQLNTHESLLSRKSNRLTLEQLGQIEMNQKNSAVDAEFLRDLNKKRTKKYKELVKRVQRSKMLTKLEDAYDLKPKKIDPEEEYDSTYRQNDGSSEISKSEALSKYSKIVARKR